MVHLNRSETVVQDFEATKLAGVQKPEQKGYGKNGLNFPCPSCSNLALRALSSLENTTEKKQVCNIAKNKKTVKL